MNCGGNWLIGVTTSYEKLGMCSESTEITVTHFRLLIQTVSIVNSLVTENAQKDIIFCKCH